MYPHEFTHNGKRYRATAIFEHGALCSKAYHVCECEFFYKGKWHPVRNELMRKEFGKRLAAQGLPIACRFYPHTVVQEKPDTIETERLPF